MALFTAISICSGYEGLGLALDRVIPGFRVVLYVEIEAFAAANLVAKIEDGLLDDAPIWSDVTKLDPDPWTDKVDICYMGFPCQPHSCAGKREGGGDERWLFDQILEKIEVIRPTYLFVENVLGLLTSRMPDGTLCIRYIFNQLEKIGYCVEDDKGQPLIGIFSAAEVGAPHQRKRVFILASRQQQGSQGQSRHGAGGQKSRWESPQPDGPACQSSIPPFPARHGQQQWLWEPGRVVGNPQHRGRDEGCEPTGRAQGYEADGSDVEDLGNAAHQLHNGGRESGQAGRGKHPDAGAGPLKPPLGGNFARPPDGLDLSRHTGLSDQELAEIREWMCKSTNRESELRALGNGVLPATAEIAFITLWQKMTKMS